MQESVVPADATDSHAGSAAPEAPISDRIRHRLALAELAVWLEAYDGPLDEALGIMESFTRGDEAGLEALRIASQVRRIGWGPRDLVGFAEKIMEAVKA